jgi:hypothetical protein
MDQEITGGHLISNGPSIKLISTGENECVLAVKEPVPAVMDLRNVREIKQLHFFT